VNLEDFVAAELARDCRNCSPRPGGVIRTRDMRTCADCGRDLAVLLGAGYPPAEPTPLERRLTLMLVMLLMGALGIAAALSWNHGFGRAQPHENGQELPR
jgi:hypothetical protein